MTFTLTIVALAAGYLLGRLRPFHTLRDHVWRKAIWGGPDTRRIHIYAVLALFPITFYRGWRKSKQPKPPRRPVPALSADFLARTKETD